MGDFLGLFSTLFDYGITVQSGASDRSLGFEDEDLGSSPGWWAAAVATYCPSRRGELPKFVSLKPCERRDKVISTLLDPLTPNLNLICLDSRSCFGNLGL